MTTEKTHFKIIIPMYQCQKWAERCLKSVLCQTYHNWQMVICVEPCSDRTYSIVSKILDQNADKRWVLIHNDVQKHVPLNHVLGIKESKPNNEDVIVCLDGDDRFFGTDVLSHLNSVYEDENVWITWGSYVSEQCMNKVGLASRPSTNENIYGPREWRYSHLKTFRYFLFKGIKEEDLKHSATRKHYIVAGDMALMFPMVEMAGEEHSRYIDKVLYIYNNKNPLNDEKTYNTLCKQCNPEIRSKLHYQQRSKEELCSL